TTRAPAAKAGNEKPIAPRCENDEPGRTTSLAVYPRPLAVLASIQAKVSKVWVTPLAGPVLPEVNKMKAGRARSAAGKLSAGGCLSISSSKCGPLSLGPAPAP